MRLPAVAIAALFACGVVLGQTSRFAERVSSHVYLAIGFVSVSILICAGLVLAKIGRLLPAATLSILSWILLGALGAGIANQSRPADYILSVVEAGRVELKTPLQWHGRLRDEPARLPWGYGYEIGLTGVEYEGSLVPARGGLRVSFSESPGQVAAPDVHAGDEIVVAAQAKRPQVFRDEGAFDRRAYLAQQNIDLVATLRAPELMERTAVARTTAATVLARIRRRLRDEIDELFAKAPQVDGVLRAMLLGDRSFVERSESTDFQKTGVFHVLVVAGLHVGALAVFLFWMGRVLRLTPFWTALATLTLLFAYVAVVEQRAPVIRAALMTAIVVIGGLFLSAARFAELRWNSGSPSADCEAAGCSRLEFSTDISGDRLYRGACRAVAGENSSTLCRGAARMARRHTRCVARAAGGAISDRPAGDDAMDFLAYACALWATPAGNVLARGYRRFPSRVGIAGDNPGIADRNAAADGARFSPRHAERAAGQSGGGAADRDCCAAGIPDAGLRTHFTCSRKTARGAAGMGDDAARAHRAVVRAISAVELPHSGAACVVDCSVSHGRSCFWRQRHASPTPGVDGPSRCRGWRICIKRTRDCDISICAATGRRESWN